MWNYVKFKIYVVAIILPSLTPFPSRNSEFTGAGRQLEDVCFIFDFFIKVNFWKFSLTQITEPDPSLTLRLFIINRIQSQCWSNVAKGQKLTPNPQPRLQCPGLLPRLRRPPSHHSTIHHSFYPRPNKFLIYSGNVTLILGNTLPRGEGNTRQGGRQYGTMNVEQWTLLILPPHCEADD